ncbi:hypothetical protein D3C75_1336760 [compost metagenome]
MNNKITGRHNIPVSTPVRRSVPMPFMAIKAAISRNNSMIAHSGVLDRKTIVIISAQ